MKKYDVAELDHLFIEAGRTELMLPPVKMKRITNSWMDIKEDWHHYNPKHQRPIKLRPTTKQITRYEEALASLQQLADGRNKRDSYRNGEPRIM